jgi:toxin YoeB
MGFVNVEFTKKAIGQYEKLPAHLYKKARSLLDEVEKFPTGGTGKVERLKGHGGNRYSRRISEKDRLIYDYFPEENLVVVISCVGHYGAH